MKKKIIIGSIIGVLIIAFVTANILNNAGAISVFGGGKAESIKVKKIEKGNITAKISASGVVEEVSKYEVYFDTPMKVQKLLVTNNQKVTKGQKLIELDTDSVNSELAQLKISKSTQELALQRAQNQDSISKNNLESARRNLEDSKDNLRKNEALFKAGAISQSELDRAVKTEADAEISFKNAQANVNLSQAQVNNGKSIDLETQKNNLESINLKIADLEKRIKKITESTVSPVDGVIVDMIIVEGSFTSNIQPAFRIVNQNQLQIKADVKEYDSKSVAVGQKVKITGDAIGKDTNITGKIVSVSPVAKKNKTASGEDTLVEVIISIDTSNSAIKPGLSVTCDIATSEKNNAIIASFEMLSDDKDGNKLVYVFDPKNGIINEKKVKLGVSSDLDIEVLEGLNEGDQAVINPKPSYKDGAKAKLEKEEKK
ncbi:MAG: multidrug resistance efflux pump [Clostridiales bacterium]|jgi:multidrug resistance efflux pump|nr:multidrug resistance efflux pump [Clostridiales bacterium]